MSTAQTNSQTEITIIITAYNIAGCIRSCLDEIIGQSYQNFDVLIVNDCSTDDTKRIAEFYQQKYPAKIKVINTPFNLGSPGAARNFALDFGAIDGKYVIFLDGDDNIKINFLEKLHDRAVKTNADITICSYCRINQESNHKIYAELRDIAIYEPYEKDHTAFINVAMWNKLIKTSLLENLRFPDLKVGEDAVFFWILCKKSNIIATLSNVLFFYNVHPSSIIENITENSIWDFAVEAHKLLEENKDNSDYYELLALSVFIHIGISTAIRVFDNHSINTKIFLSKIRSYLYENNIMSKRKFLTLSCLIKHGVKGLAIWLTRVSYRFHVTHISLHIYNIFRQVFGNDLKF